MKHIILPALAIFFISSPVLAQDSVRYIPGMPVPQATSSSASSASSGTADASEEAPAGKISKVSKAGESDFNGAGSQAAAPAKLNDGTKGYKGVTPPTRLVPENQSTFAKTTANQLSWIGFLPEEGAHRIFLQTTEPTSYERIATSNDRVEIHIKSTKLAVSNNNRELDMSYFNTPFAKAKATQDSSGIKVVVTLKEAVPCEIQQHDNMIDIIAKK